MLPRRIAVKNIVPKDVVGRRTVTVVAALFAALKTKAIAAETFHEVAAVAFFNAGLTVAALAGGFLEPMERQVVQFCNRGIV